MENGYAPLVLPRGCPERHRRRQFWASTPAGSANEKRYIKPTACRRRNFAMHQKRRKDESKARLFSSSSFRQASANWVKHVMETPAPDSNLVSPSGAPSPSPEPPKTSIPTTIGILNIIFGSLMMLCILCSSMYLAVMGAIGAPINAIQQQQFQQALQTERLQKLQRLREQEQAAKDEKEKADLKAKQKALEEQPLPKMPDFTKFMREQSFVSWMIADYVSGLILNLAMVISGIGLLRRKEWGRVSGIWVAILKIVRLIVLYTIYPLGV